MKSGFDIAKILTFKISNFILHITCIDVVVLLIFHWIYVLNFKNLALGKEKFKKKNGNVRGTIDFSPACA